MRAILVAVAALSVTGCLSLPPRHEPCGAPADYQARAFPPTDRSFQLRDVIGTDINGDGATDLLISSTADGDPAAWGFYVLLGPQTDASALVYHAFVNTGASPDAVAVRNVIYSRDCPDVTVFGEEPVRATGLVEIYELSADERPGGWEMFAPTPVVTRDVGFVPENDGTPVMVTYGEFEGLGHESDLAVADLYQLRFLYTGGNPVENLPTAAVRPVGADATPNTPWNAINGIYPTPGLSGQGLIEDLIVVELEDLTWLRNDGSGGFSVETKVHSDAFTTMAPRPVDLDGVAPIDIAGGAGVGFGAYRLALNGTSVAIDALAWNQVLPVYNQLNDFAVADLGGSPLPEVVALEVDENRAEPSYAMLVDSLFASGSELLPTSVSVYDFDRIDPDRLQITDFNGDGTPEVWAFDSLGNGVCLRRASSGGALEPC